MSRWFFIRTTLVSAVISFVLSCTFFFHMVITTGGSEPKDACRMVEGNGGLLPLKSFSSIVYSCDPTVYLWFLIGWFTFLAWVFVLPVVAIVVLVWRDRRQRSARR